MFSPPPPLQLKFGLQYGGDETIEVLIGRTSWKVTPGTPRSERSPKPAGYYEKEKKKTLPISSCSPAVSSAQSHSPVMSSAMKSPLELNRCLFYIIRSPEQ